MYVEKRKAGKSIKYYLIYSYREGKKVRKVRRFLGTNLSPKDIASAAKKAKSAIKPELLELSTEIFNFTLTKRQVDRLNQYDKQILIHHLQKAEWKRFTEQFTYNTNAIEGSTVRLDEVDKILYAKEMHNDDEIETKGVAKAVDFIRTTKEELSLELIRKLHKLCFQGSKHFAGEFRKVEVVVSDGMGNIVHRGVPSSHLHLTLQELVDWHKKNKKKFKPLVLAAIIHNQFEHIHPFQDGNGRVGRLLLNYVLLKNKYPPINISFEDRGEYYYTLQEYSKSQNLRPTIEFLIKQYDKTLEQVTTKRKKR
jgi:Fic family protein